MEHTWNVKDHLKNINVVIMDAEDSLRGYYLSGDPTFMRPWKTAREKIGPEFSVLEGLISNNPAQKNNLIQLRALIDRKLRKFDEINALYEAGGLNDVMNVIRMGEGRETMDEVRMLDVIMEKEEQELLIARRDRFFREYQRALWINNLINGSAILILILFYRLIHIVFVKKKAVEAALQRSNDNLESTVRSRTTQLSFLSRHLLSVTEQEKAKLARELHDEMGSSLTVISMDLSIVSEKLKKTDAGLASQLQRTKQTLQEAVDLKRRIIEDLRPSMLDNLGLAASIRSHCEKISRMPGLAYTIDIAEEFDDIDSAWAIALFRIVQESLSNVIKYAHATNVKVTLARQTAGLWLQILDDGIGIPNDALDKPKSHGLLGMRERASLIGGSFSAGPGAGGRGTAIEVLLPFPA